MGRPMMGLDQIDLRLTRGAYQLRGLGSDLIVARKAAIKADPLSKRMPTLVDRRGIEHFDVMRLTDLPKECARLDNLLTNHDRHISIAAEGGHELKDTIAELRCAALFALHCFYVCGVKASYDAQTPKLALRGYDDEYDVADYPHPTFDDAVHRLTHKDPRSTSAILRSVARCATSAIPTIAKRTRENAEIIAARNISV